MLWAILLAQQAHALQYCVGNAPPAWEVTEHPERWGVRAMHALLRERQKQRVTLEGGSRAPRDTRTVGRGLGGAQQVCDLDPPSRARALANGLGALVDADAFVA